MEIPPSPRSSNRSEEAPPQGASTPKQMRMPREEPEQNMVREVAKPQHAAPAAELQVNGTSEKSIDDVQDDKIRVTLDRGNRG